tara:strand:+ start:231 stop:1874 length:1644 start_codon:yes stop_codon:yes gene_type:complete
MIIFVCDAFVEQYTGGAELTTQAIIDASSYPVMRVLSNKVTPELMSQHSDSYWVFGNFSNLAPQCIVYAIKNLDYSIIEYDYKFCKYRSIKKHKKIENVCNCHNERIGKMVSTFLAKSKLNFWMSQKQLDTYKEIFPFLKGNNVVLSSVFSESTLEHLVHLNLSIKKKKIKKEKWLILDSPSWIKGRDVAVHYAKHNNLDYELVWGLSYPQMLLKLAEAKGIIFLPLAADTCPRFVIEAKMLGCDLILNEDVQHKNEPWFDNPRSTYEYLSTRADFFWDKIEKIASKNLGFSVPEKNTDSHIKLIVPFYNAGAWLKNCIDSLKKQANTNFECIMIDDMSTDNSVKIAKKHIDSDSRFKLIVNKEKRYALGNICHAIENAECNDDDIIVLLDGDDWLASSQSLSILSSEYSKEKCLMTYGSYIYSPSSMKGVEPSAYSDDVIQNNLFREDHWRASHLRSFKYKLWKHLNHNDLKDEQGEYYKMTYDQAIMLPLLEMAGDRSHYIDQILYVYNKENPLSIDKNKAQEQYNLALKIRNKKKYDKLDESIL